MKQIALITIMTILFAGNLFAESFSLDEAVAFLEENGYEFTIAYDEAVKELPEGAVVFTPFGIEIAKDDAEEMIANGGMAIESTTTQENYVFGDIWNYPQYFRLMIVGGYNVSPIGNLVSYKFMWHRNTTTNPNSPSWVNITRNDVCTITAQRFGPLANCSCFSGEGGFVCSTTSFGEELLNYFSGSSACSQCDNLGVFSVRFGVNPRSLTWVYDPITHTWIPIYLYLGWTYVLSDGDGLPFSPVWNLCETDLYTTFCP